jgi:YVTN family beta-propeller protein
MTLRSVLPLFPVVLLALVPTLARADHSNSLMDVSPDGRRLLVANPDNGTVTVVDVATRKKRTEIAVGEKPEGVTWIGAGPLAAVTVYRDAKVVFVDAEAGKVIDSLSVPAEPYGVVATRDGSRLYVTHEYPGVVSEIDMPARKVLREMKAGSMVRGLCLSPDEKRLYVTEFYTSRLVALERESGKVVDAWPGHVADNLSRHVVLHPTRPKAYLSHIRSRIEIIHGAGSIFPHVSVCDLNPGTEKRRTSFAMDTYNGVYVVTNPWEAALSPDGKRLYTIYAGTNDMNLSDVIDDDYREIERHGRAVTVGKLPRAVRVSPDGKTVFIYNTMDFQVGFYDADMREQARVEVCSAPKTPEWVRGKILFNTALPPLTSRRWIACSSCHPDGHSDGRVWNNPEGQRKTMALFGMAHTHPLHWSADRDEVQDFEYTIRGRLMQGRGLIAGPIKPKVGFQPTELDEKTSGRSADLDALAIYSNSFDFTRLSPHAQGPGKLSPQAERGKALFFDKTVGCAECHSGPYYTDNTLQKPFKLHDVGTGKDDPSEKIGPKYKTPTLLGVYRTAPYLHHGRAATLLDVLTTCNKEDRHGRTSHLKAEQLEDIVEFLKALPYELPPLETPNTVNYRLAPAKKDE